MNACPIAVLSNDLVSVVVFLTQGGYECVSHRCSVVH
jgi:hypothetical protein